MAGSTSGISPSFLGLSRSSGQVTHVLLTRSRLCPRPKPGSSLHLHVLSTPPAFVLSQDQTLRKRLACQSGAAKAPAHCLVRKVVRSVLLWRDPVHLRARPGLDGIWLSPPPANPQRGRAATGRTWTRLAELRTEPSSRTLLSFQRPPRPRTGTPPFDAVERPLKRPPGRGLVPPSRCVAQLLGPGGLPVGRVKGLQGGGEY